MRLAALLVAYTLDIIAGVLDWIVERLDAASERLNPPHD